MDFSALENHGADSASALVSSLQFCISQDSSQLGFNHSMHLKSLVLSLSQ